MKIALISTRSVLTRHSNAHYYMAHALRRYADHVDIICPETVYSRAHPNAIVSRLLYACGYTSRARHTVLARFAARVERYLQKQSSYDFIFLPMGAELIPFMDTQHPIVYASDATFALTRDYLPWCSDLSDDDVDRAQQNEHTTLQRAALVNYPSEWAAASSRDDYHTDPEKISVIAWGANLDEQPTHSEACAERQSETCRLLFAGAPWPLKGGPTAIETLQHLHTLGVPATLTICGIDAQTVPNVPGVHATGWLNKHHPRDRKRLYELYQQSHFFLFPSVAECYGHVACEANAFGLPVIARHTGGIHAVVTHGVNGVLIAPDQDGSAYAQAIAELWMNKARYHKCVEQSREQYEQRLNWDHWASTLLQHAARAMSQHSTHGSAASNEAEQVTATMRVANSR